MVQLRLPTRFVSLAFIGMVVFAPLAQAAFSDVSGGDFAQYINDLSSKGVIAGNGAYFYPKFNLTRGELAKVLTKAANLTTNAAGGQRFPDVPVTHTFFDYISTLANRGTVRGYADGTFRPNANVSRGEFAKMVIGAFGFDINTASGPHFSFDVPADSVFYPYVETLYNRNIASGYNGTIRFGVNDPITREQMAKIVSLAMQSQAGTLAGRASGGAVISRDIPLTYNGGLPRMNIKPASGSSRLELNPERFPYLAQGFMYELWVIDTAGAHSAGKFNFRNGSISDARGIPMSRNFNLPVAWSGVTSVEVSIEPNNDTEATAARTRIVRGNVVAGATSFDIDFPIGLPESTARAYVTKGPAGQDNVLNIEISQLPDLRPIGWSYEAWYVIGGQAQTAGAFVGNGTRSFFKSTELPSDLMQATEVKVSLEPNPDDSDAPSGIIPWSGRASGVVTTTTSTTTPTTAAQDTELYKGLTTDMTAPSIRARTVMETATDVIVQAYAASPILADGEDQSIVVKVSDRNGNPISDLDLRMSRVDGPAADFSDPQEVGNNSGIYIGTYTPDDEINTTDTATIRIQSDNNGSTSDDDEVEIPSLELSFDVSSSDRIGSPRSMEIDVTKKKLVVDENDNDTSDAETIVLVTVLDSNNRTVSDVLSSGLSLSTDGDTISGSVKNNLKYYRLDDSFFDIDNEDDDITVRRTFLVQLIPGSSDSFAPIVSSEYRVEAQFIAEEEDD
ncbi:MAG: S-layer homology domain-containing protein [Candidatus Abawacabacteria bacterium]|nr:S-layer homology domain-containing protein [Candidatus Abawacabacteria bacterium]